ncbi:MAG: hypothetical protein MJ066_04460 [Clostridia bacterium]|nr:hypothetical protein [Clostridia bacterium]
MYYGFILLFSIVLGIVDFFIIAERTVWFVILAVVASVVGVILIDAIVAFIVRWICPAKWFSYNKEIYAGRKKECKFYEFLGIKKWKDKIPEWGKATNFRKNKISDPKNNEYVERYILEANYGVMIHFLSIVFGFLIVFVLPLKYFLCFGIPVAIVNGIYNALSLFILRYNLPKLHQLHRINEKRAKREETSLIA